MKIGHGFDVHRLVKGRDCIIGGVKIPYHLGLDGHSDADVLIHAVCDALIGAMGLGDIGHFFPDNDPQYKNINSRDLLSQVNKFLHEEKFKIINIDATIICEEPKIFPHIEAMKKNLSQDLNCESSLINIKATTTEKMGSIGRGEGIAAEVVCLINAY
jgi:2-C-methyl-D-erythritol 2,4-cyclodiphosphate synthase